MSYAGSPIDFNFDNIPNSNKNEMEEKIIERLITAGEILTKIDTINDRFLKTIDPFLNDISTPTELRDKLKEIIEKIDKSKDLITKACKTMDNYSLAFYNPNKTLTEHQISFTIEKLLEMIEISEEDLYLYLSSAISSDKYGVFDKDILTKDLSKTDKIIEFDEIEDKFI